ncbi:hypothetical protein Tco_1011950 [Tanacetum coccineum]
MEWRRPKIIGIFVTNGVRLSNVYIGCMRSKSESSICMVETYNNLVERSAAGDAKTQCRATNRGTCRAIRYKLMLEQNLWGCKWIVTSVVILAKVKILSVHFRASKTIASEDSKMLS